MPWKQQISLQLMETSRPGITIEPILKKKEEKKYSQENIQILHQHQLANEPATARYILAEDHKMDMQFLSLVLNMTYYFN